MRRPKAAFVGFGEVNTPRDIVERKCAEAREALERLGIDLVCAQPVSDVPDGSQAAQAVEMLSREQFDFLVLCVAGWIPSHAVVQVANEFAHKPMLLWGLAGWTEGGRLITTADQAGTTALRKPMAALGYRFKYVYNCPGRALPVAKISAFAQAAMAESLLKRARIGMMGFRDMNLYGTLYDGISLRSKIGPEVETFEMLEVMQRIECLEPRAVQEVVERVKADWVFERPTEDETLRKGAKFYLALRQKVEERGYEAVSLIDVDGMRKLAKFPPSMVFMLLANEMGVCTIPENDVPGAVTQLVTKYLTGQIGAYLEFYEFMEDRVLMGVPDYVPAEVTDGPVTVKPAAFGEFSAGILNVSKLKTGRVTLCRLANTGDRYSLHMATGDAVEPRKWEEAGWSPPAPQLPGLEIVLDSPVEKFAQDVMGQHYIISYGDNTETFKDLCALLGVEVIWEGAAAA